MEASPDLAQAIDGIVRRDRGRLIAALIGAVGQFDLAEEAFSDALESAWVHWARHGLPRAPEAWLLQVARRKAIDRIRKGQSLSRHMPELERLMAEDEAEAGHAPDAIEDSRLRLIFTCCHPALDPKTRVALTLRTICGLTTREIARAFLDKESAMGQRLSRAKAKIAGAGIPYKVPEREDWPDRLNSVLTVIYLIFNEGYAASSGDALIRVDLCEEALFLARMVDGLAPGEAEIEGLLALMLLTHARRRARLDVGGAFVPLDAQDPGDWDSGQIAEGLAMLDRAVARLQPGPFQIKAAIQALHVEARDRGKTDWRQIVLLYDALIGWEPSAVVRLNRAVALAENGGLDAALAEMDVLAADLAEYQPFHAARAELLRRAGREEAAQDAYGRAIALATSPAERAFLLTRKKRPSTKLGRSPTGR